MKLSEIGKTENFVVSRMANLYILEDGNILKLFKNPRSLYEIDRYKYMLEYQNDSFIFPFEFIYDSDKFYGYITKRASGKTIKSVFSQSNLINLSNNSKEFEKNLDYVSEGGIILYDFHNENLLYDGKKFSAIDHDENGIFRTPTESKNTNQQYHRIEFGKLFEANISSNKHTKLIKEKILQYKYMKIRPSEMIIKVKEDMDGYFKEDIKTLDELNDILKR